MESRTPAPDAGATPGPAAPQKAGAPNAREVARRRKRQVVGVSLVAFGATVALVMSHPLTSDAAAPASVGTGSGGASVPVPQEDGPAPRSGTSSAGNGAPVQPNQARPPAQASGGAAPQIRSGGGRRGSVGSGGS